MRLPGAGAVDVDRTVGRARIKQRDQRFELSRAENLNTPKITGAGDDFLAEVVSSNALEAAAAESSASIAAI